MNQIISVNQLYIKRGPWQLAPVSFALKSGQALQIIGKNGSGKSSILKAIIGLYLYRGVIKNSAVNTYYIGHKTGLKPSLSVADSLYFTSMLYDKILVRKNRINYVLKTLSLPKNRVVEELSSGQKQKLALARLWLIQAHKSTLWLLDEPFAYLDSQTQQLLLNKLNEHIENDGSLIITSHNKLTLSNLALFSLDSC